MSDRVCTIDGCLKPAKTRGWCGMHYERWRRHGDPLAMRESPRHQPTVFPGERYGRLTVIEEAGVRRGRRHYRCTCDCGSEAEIRAGDLRAGNTRSCGCLRRDCAAGLTRTQHGHSSGGRSPTYRSWQSMIGRCSRPSGGSFAHYGGRVDAVTGQADPVRVCGRLGSRFENFLADLGERPLDQEATERKGEPVLMTLDRIDPEGHYSCGKCAQCIANGWPANVRWATDDQQRRNKRPRRRQEVA